jgi:hypothetical protein
VCDSTNGAIQRTLAAVRKQKGATLMTARQTARALVHGTKMSGLHVLYEVEGRLQAVVDAVAKRASKLRVEKMHGGDHSISLISHQGVRTLNEDGSITLRETATRCRGQHVPKQIVASLTRDMAMPAAGIGLKLVIVGSEEDEQYNTAASAAAPREVGLAATAAAAVGVVTLTPAAKRKRKLERTAEVSNKRLAATAVVEDEAKEKEAQSRAFTGGLRCIACSSVFTTSARIAKHKCTPHSKCRPGGHR